MAKSNKYCLLIDDDVHLPPNLPIASHQINGKTARVGCSIKSTGANGSKKHYLTSKRKMLNISLPGYPKSFVKIRKCDLRVDGCVYILGFIFFNAFHPRRKNEMMAWKIQPVYFGMKMALVFVDTGSVYYPMYEYVKFLIVRHSRVIENYASLNTLKGFM
jgi:hypothetical protein